MPPSPQAQDAAMRFVFFILLMLFFSNNQNSGPAYANGPLGLSGEPYLSPRAAFDASLNRQRHAISTLNATKPGDWRYDKSMNDGPAGTTGLNLTGFRDVDDYAWNIWENVTERVRGMRERAGVLDVDGPTPAMYTNVSGVVRGKWVRSSIGFGGLKGWSSKQLNLSAIAPQVAWTWSKFNRNITGSAGAMSLVVRERHEKELLVPARNESELSSLVRDIQATLTIEDESHGGEGWKVNLRGVHWPSEGALVLTTTSEKFAGIYALPHLTLSEHYFLTSQKMLNNSLRRAFAAREKVTWGFPADSYAEDEDPAIPRCEFVVYAQVHPVSIAGVYAKPDAASVVNLPAMMQALETELRFPQGMPVLRAPSLDMTLVAFSPDCGFVIESKGPPDYAPNYGTHLRGLKQEVLIGQVKYWCLIWGVVISCQVALLRSQIKEASTPSIISRVSLHTCGAMVVGDWIVVGSLMLLASSAQVVFPAATLTAFACAISAGLGIRFLADVYNVQEPERREANRIRDTQRAEELVASTLRRHELLTRHRALLESRTEPGAQVGTANELAVPIVTAAGVDMPVAPTSTPAEMHARSPFTENLPSVAVPDAPVIVPSDQDVDAETAQMQSNVSATTPIPSNATLTPAQIADATRLIRTHDTVTTYGQFLLILLVFFFLTISSISWPTVLRKAYFHILALLYFSFWLPQIHRNAIRNSRKAFQWRFIFGQSILRLVPWCYFWGKEDNVLEVDRSLVGIGFTVCWVWVQILVMAVQDVVSPRFMVPKGWLAEAWDYHPVLRADDIEDGGLPLGLIRRDSIAAGSPWPTLTRLQTGDFLPTGTTTHNNSSAGETMSIDCAICIQRVDVPILSKDTAEGDGSGSAGVTGVIGLLARRLYMVTPCRHVFHSKCLEGWMKFRLQCPICRENLPPL